MPGLIDSDEGVQFGTGLQFQTQIGTASLIIGPEGSTQEELFWGEGSGTPDLQLVWDAQQLVWGQ